MKRRHFLTAVAATPLIATPFIKGEMTRAKRRNTDCRVIRPYPKGHAHTLRVSSQNVPPIGQRVQIDGVAYTVISLGIEQTPNLAAYPTITVDRPLETPVAADTPVLLHGFTVSYNHSQTESRLL